MWRFEGPRTVDEWSKFVLEGYKKESPEFIPPPAEDPAAPIFLTFVEFQRRVLSPGSPDWIIAMIDNSTESHNISFDWSLFAGYMMNNSFSIGLLDDSSTSDLLQLPFIEDFPVIKLFSKGRVYGYYGKNELNEWLTFAFDTFKTAPFEDIDGNHTNESFANSNFLAVTEWARKNIVVAIGFVDVIFLGIGFLVGRCGFFSQKRASRPKEKIQ